ncbi:MAG: sodium-dependent transporter, partial [Bacteroidetes bacterium]|nr:sodium-dependent transporter [Bacteroidota bacterium]
GTYNKLGGPNWAYVGLFGVICGVMILSFYNVVAGWALAYFFKISFGGLLSAGDASAAFFDEEFKVFVKEVGDNLVISLLFMVLTGFIVARGVKKGIEAASKILMPLLIIILVGLILYSLTLNNAMEGISFYLKPDFSKVGFDTVYSAMGHAFFSLSLGMGALITYGSYITKKENIISSAAIVSVADVGVAFLAGLLIFPLVFLQNVDPGSGPGLVFITLPGIFAALGPILGKIIGATFFLLLSLAALTSTISLLEVPVSYMVDERNWSRRNAVIVMATAIFVIGLASMLSQGAVPFFTEFLTYGGVQRDFLTFIEDLFLNIGLPLGGCLMSIFIAYRWKTHNLTEEISDGLPGYAGSLMSKFINFMLTYIIPVLLGLMFILTVLSNFFGIDVISMIFGTHSGGH